MWIKVTNNSGVSIKVSINQWGTGGSTEYFTIENSKDENWNRTDDSGFVMIINVLGTVTPYYVLYNSHIKVTKTAVKDLTYDVSLKPANLSYTKVNV
ncbi:hypothetical protein ABW636_21265 [Aquimarina sp. 2201CG1-2-11]|uniref:hypothetical protein n=1 Tax=Aquimarina discodermiae TaxID=3231043 RepID=UPI0034619417